jgi:hypothetical protein
MYYLFNSVESKLIAILKTDSELIDRVKLISVENEDFDFSILGVSDAEEYIEEYCGNLNLLEVISIQDYANKIGYDGKNPSITEIQDYAQEDLDWTIWDYPLDEFNDVIENHDGEIDELVLVQVGEEIRVCEC